MSYESQNFLPVGTSLTAVKKLISLLGYVKFKNSNYFWACKENYHNYVEIELNITYNENKQIVVYTRSRICRSYWDHLQQNETIKLIRDFFGGYFITGAGRNRYYRIDDNVPSKLQSGCYLARWKFHNALIKPKIYLCNMRTLGLTENKFKVTKLHFVDEYNPLLFSNNLILPYLLAIWEDYMKAIFIALLHNMPDLEKVIKQARPSDKELTKLSNNRTSIEEIIANSLSFQHPKIIATNFRMINRELNIESLLKKPYIRKSTKKSLNLFSNIERYIQLRNKLVHEGSLEYSLTGNKLNYIIEEFNVAVERIYVFLGEHYDFIPLREAIFQIPEKLY